MVVVRDYPDAVSVGYSSWAQWRADHEPVGWVVEEHRPGQCPMCWGQRKIWEPGPLGLIPVVCDGCAGTGRPN